MGAGRLQGTSWHVEYLKKDDTDPRHDKRNCEYYKGNNNCRKRGDKICIGGRYCTQYLRKPERTKKQLEYKAKELEESRNYENLIITYKYKFVGFFTVKYLEDNEIVKYAIGKNENELDVLGAIIINQDAPLFRKVLVTEPNHEFEINGIKVLLIDKEMNRYRIE